MFGPGGFARMVVWSHWLEPPPPLVGCAGVACDALPAFPPERDLRVEDISALAAAVPAAKALGADGCAFAHVARRPRPVMEALVAFHAVVEASGRWPASWPAH